MEHFPTTRVDASVNVFLFYEPWVLEQYDETKLLMKVTNDAILRRNEIDFSLLVQRNNKPQMTTKTLEFEFEFAADTCRYH